MSTLSRCSESWESKLNPNIAMSLDRADELLADLNREYDQSLKAQTASPRAVHLTHEVCERLRSVLDRLVRLYWENHIAPTLDSSEREKALIYFPVTKDQNSFASVLGRWRWAAVKAQHSSLEKFLLGIQPFHCPKNDWIRVLSELAAASKHIDLVPQKRTEERRITVTGQGSGSVSWGPGVSFGSGVSIMGAPVDPITQRIVPTHGVTEKIDIWVSFLIDGYNVNALSFCADACTNVRRIAINMTTRFNL